MSRESGPGWRWEEKEARARDRVLEKSQDQWGEKRLRLREVEGGALGFWNFSGGD